MSTLRSQEIVKLIYREEFTALIKERLARPGKGTVALLFLQLLNRLENRGKRGARGK